MNRTLLCWCVTICWCLAVLLLSSQPTPGFGDFEFGILLFFAGIALFVYWLIRLGNCRKRKYSLIALLIEPIVTVGAVSLALCEVPKTLRFRLSEPALNKAVAEHVVGENIHVGLYQFKEIAQTPEGTVFTLDVSDINHWGFLYHPHTQPQTKQIVIHEQLASSWYLWFYDPF